LLKNIFKFLDTLISNAGRKNFAKYMRAKQKLLRLQERGASAAEIRRAAEDVASLGSEVLEGGPCDGFPLTKKWLEVRLRYMMIPKMVPYPVFCVYENVRGTKRYVFLRSFSDPHEYDVWSSEHPQERGYE
jgi:hypothetical protein